MTIIGCCFEQSLGPLLDHNSIGSLRGVSCVLFSGVLSWFDSLVAPFRSLQMTSWRVSLSYLSNYLGIVSSVP